ncbi:MAG: nitrite reductase large subunit NirB [Acidimicrobiia bacterium]
MSARRTLVVAGHGMVGHRLLEQLAERDADRRWRVVVFSEESRPAYDRVGLTSCFDGRTPDDLSLVAPGFFRSETAEVRALHVGDRVASVDRQARQVTSASGIEEFYDALVMATGSYPFVPPVPGNDAKGCFVYRTLDDVAAITEWAAGCQRGAVIGGGLLGLEAAGALRRLGLETHVVEFAPRLMPVQVDDGGGAVLRAAIESLGVAVHTGMATSSVLTDRGGRAKALRFAEGDDLPVDIVVFSAGIRPRDDLARSAGLDVGERGGIVVDDTLRTSDPDIYAVGECALVGGRVYGLVAPGYEMAAVLADRLCGGDATFTGADMSTKLKLLGVDVASFGDAHGSADGSRSIVFSDPVGGVYQRLVVRDGDVTGGILVGDAALYPTLAAMARGDMPSPDDPGALIGGGGDGGGAAALGVAGLAGTATVCSCNNVPKHAICAAVDGGAADVGAIKACTRAGTGCGGCVPLVTEILRNELTRKGVAVSDELCEHFAHSRQELMDIVRVGRISTFSELLANAGTGLGCEICKPAVASMLAALSRAGYILDGEGAALQDTNDHFLANLQKNGTYSVVPRVPGGEITPDQLIRLGEVAKQFGLYTKITGGQRIDLFGARVEALPAIWAALAEVGLESGHAYGKALRTVKSCVGRTWCRYGVQDSTSMAIRLELRYRGLRAPHKVKMAVSGCVRECAEAQGKDIGVIATEAGWSLYVCGNGGMRPQHATLLAADLDDEHLIRYVDRFFMFYVRTADRLERTATWFNKLEGGIDYLRRVVIDDALGVCSDLEADMARHVETYQCEWAATLADPVRMARFRSFVNSDSDDDSIVFVSERGQPRPATAAEVAPSGTRR